MTETPNTQTADETLNAPQPPKNWKQKGLSIGFNIASGFAVAGMLAKFGVVGAVLTAAMPVAAPAIAVTAATIVLTGILTGLGTSALRYGYDRVTAGKASMTATDVVKRMGWAMIGGALFFGANELIGSFFGAPDAAVSAPEVTPQATATPDVTAVEPAAGDAIVTTDVECEDAVAKAAEILAKENDLTPCADEALHLAQAGSAQATKDLGLFFLSGYEGVPVDTAMAVDLLKQAATAGNEQAIQDLAYLEFHGKAGFVANPGEALKAMMTVDTATAREFVAQWTAMGVEAPADVVAPTVDTPVVETPVAEAPVVEAPVVEAPAAETVAPDAPQADGVAADVDCVDPVAKAAVIMAAETDLTPCAEQSLKMAQAGNAQGVKDLAAFFLNGTDGLPKDPALGVELLKGAAEAGNVQAQVDLAYLQYHGLHGVEGGKDAALAAMQEIKSAAAREFVSAWTGQAVEGSGDMVLDISADAKGNMIIDIDAGSEKVLSQSCTFSMAANGTGTVDCAIETKAGVKTIQAIIEDCDKMFPNLKPAF
ncbi:SEL1-like repeat protein [Micavibrio aeruginosavorus]|uniref:Sel1 repeat family protein n=1 Tax=Micavibrio aeruginosavorus (strain ARL-13) TaxID=856793 RepID=G2KLI1_MICAA|nr:SEL1-like repeat protein [Micavibrio aeruginosavorus]AEP08811.1 sel1 repeat family protein [Micavibrio aeruginosavorus ARL-13]